MAASSWGPATSAQPKHWLKVFVGAAFISQKISTVSNQSFHMFDVVVPCNLHWLMFHLLWGMKKQQSQPSKQEKTTFSQIDSQSFWLASLRWTRSPPHSPEVRWGQASFAHAQCSIYSQNAKNSRNNIRLHHDCVSKNRIPSTIN